jgi:transposase
MQYYAGLDVSVKGTSVCIIDKAGKVVREVKVATKPAAILAALTQDTLASERIGLEAGPLSQWLYSALAEAGLPVICVETRHMKAALSAQINKSDRNDARGIAQMMRVGLYRPVHVKTLASQKQRMLLTSRRLLQCKRSTSRTTCVARCAISASSWAGWARSNSRIEFVSYWRTMRIWPRSSNHC